MFLVSIVTANGDRFVTDVDGVEDRTDAIMETWKRVRVGEVLVGVWERHGRAEVSETQLCSFNPSHISHVSGWHAGH